MTELPERTDVLVVGAGATGLALAATLAGAQVDFVVIDKLLEGRNLSRAIGTVPRTLEMLQQLQVADRLSDLGNHAGKATFFSGDRDRRIATVRFGHLATRFPFVLLLPQSVTEKVILTRLEELGGRVHRPYTLTGLSQDDSVVTATVSGADGEVRTIRARYVVGADGARSTVRELIGVDFPGETFRQTFMLFDLYLDPGPPPDEIQMFCSRLGAVTMGALPSGITRLTISIDDPPDAVTPQDVQVLVDERGPAHYRPKVLEVLDSARSRVHHRVAERFRSDRVFLGGDAAHANSPVSGQGMNLGIQDGITLGNILAGALTGSSERLDAYERERRPIAREAVGMTRRMNALATDRGRWTSGFRDTFLPIANLSVVNRRLAFELSGLKTR